MSTTTPTTSTQPAPGVAPKMSHKEILEALSGLLLGMFVAILSSTVVSNALPRIVNDLHGTESGYTWVVTAALLATTISTPIWGKLADLFSKKLLVQIALVIFVVASAIAGLSTSMGMLITLRVFQGLGGGGLLALAQVILASMVSPRERGRYSGYLGATFALATVGGPLIGGVLTEHLSWHWCFYVGVPFAVIAFFVLQFKLKLPEQPRREVSIDYLGAILLALGISALLIWVSLAGTEFDWASWWTVALVAAGVVFLALAVLAEHRAKEPIVPLKFFRNPTIALSAAASLFVGVAMFGATIFLSQYFQLARHESPTMAGVMTIPMIAGLFLASTVAGQAITRTGKWKAWLVVGGVLLTAGLALMGTIEYDTNYWVVAPYMALIGLGVGMMMQNLVLAVQNVADARDMGSASSFVAFARSLGGAIGVSALGAVLGHRVTSHLETGLSTAGIDPAAATSALGSSTGVPDLDAIPAPLRAVVQAAYGSSIADVFLLAAPFALIAFVITLFFKERALRSDDGTGQDVAEATTSSPDRVAATTTGTPGAHGAARPDREETTSVPAQPTRTDTGLSLSGAVRHHDQRPLAGAVVTLADQSGQQVSRTSTGADGSYRLALPTGGTYLLIVAAAHVAPSATLVGVGDTSITRDVTLSGRSAITGRVLAHEVTGDVDAGDHHGVRGALVTLTDVTGEVVGSTRTDGGGSYAFDQLMGGSYVLTAQSESHRPLARGVEVPDSGALACDLVLTGGGRLTGTVVAASDGRVLKEAAVTLVDSSGEVVGSVLTGADGSYSFEDLAGGHYTLTAAGFAPVATSVDIEEDTVSAAQITLGSGDAPSTLDLTRFEDTSRVGEDRR
ncbi:EmrB/QacA subfamily drug resistance transporter [Kineococcus radiotolerans]|uniref:Drug resistance transporter, EmrB/QacA subfamily n=2 Tax=Kineococcus radiotolerans TaxID=131568 RepID=A6WDT7_KINRD|nr:MFS transporter [Kineococcus radiotolerans]ABS04976.1 drug resistance transporter, EmrB/QacA subfamily [Kineococcus radiotolerans SRS30216 = ATCC BAA-149]MBB2901821.1 EmrB/QacA subfamily drug resistance transporter [Kineococcus radiotolerans]